MHPRTRTSRTKTTREFRQTKIRLASSQEAACNVQQNDRLHKRCRSTALVGTLRVFVYLECGLQSPKDERLHTVRIYPCCKDLECVFEFERWLENPPKMTVCAMLGCTQVVGTLRVFLRLARCQEHPKCSGVAQCTNVVYVQGALCHFFTFQKVLKRSEVW